MARAWILQINVWITITSLVSIALLMTLCMCYVRAFFYHCNSLGIPTIFLCLYSYIMENFDTIFIVYTSLNSGQYFHYWAVCLITITSFTVNTPSYWNLPSFLVGIVSKDKVKIRATACTDLKAWLTKAREAKWEPNVRLFHVPLLNLPNNSFRWSN